jgi:hypothetical protein
MKQIGERGSFPPSRGIDDRERKEKKREYCQRKI